jgi:hypothetical protein
MDESETIHFVLRVPLLTRVHGRRFNTIEAHNQALTKQGRVALAKFGQAGSATRVDLIKDQIERRTGTLLILVVKDQGRFFGFSAPLASIRRGEPDPQTASVAPEYYARLEGIGSLWFTVESPFVARDISEFRLLSNGRPLVDVVRECRTSSMLVRG